MCACRRSCARTFLACQFKVKNWRPRLSRTSARAGCPYDLRSNFGGAQDAGRLVKIIPGVQEITACSAGREMRLAILCGSFFWERFGRWVFGEVSE